MSEAVLTSTPNLCFEQDYENIRMCCLKTFSLGCKISYIFGEACFRNAMAGYRGSFENISDSLENSS